MKRRVLAVFLAACPANPLNAAIDFQSPLFSAASAGVSGPVVGAEIRGAPIGPAAMDRGNGLVEKALEKYGSGGAMYRECRERQYGATRSDACVAVDIVKQRIRALTGNNWKLVQAIAFTENRLDHDDAEVNASVRSHADAKGLMQITKLIWNYYVNSSHENGRHRDDGHRILGPKGVGFDGQGPYGINNSILVANAYLTDLKSRYCRRGESATCRRLIAAAYNAGETAVTRAGGVPRIRETQQYVRVFEQKYASAR